MKWKLQSALSALLVFSAGSSAIGVHAQEFSFDELEPEEAQTEFEEENSENTEESEAVWEEVETQTEDLESASVADPEEKIDWEVSGPFVLPDDSQNKTIYQHKLYLEQLNQLKKQYPDQAKTLDARIAKTQEAMRLLETIDMYRLYNPNSGEHFYTAEANERDYLISAGWKDEGIGWYAPKNTGDPVYRVYNPNGGDHHYTISSNERDALVKAGWKDEGVGWKSMDRNDINAAPVYRQYNPNQFSCNHNYSTSSNEDGQLFEWGWKKENIGWYGVFPYSKVVSTSNGAAALKVFDANTMKQLSGWQTILGDSYYFNPSREGTMQTGEAVLPGKKQDEGQKTYYFDTLGRQVLGFYGSGSALRYIDRQTGEMVKNKELFLPSMTYDGAKGFYDVDGNGHCSEGRVMYNPGSKKSSLTFYHPSTEKSIPLYDAMKKVGLSDRARRMMDIGIQYEGWNYVWGGREPSAGGFDCSGLVTYCIRQGLGKNIYATAEMLYDRHVDLVSFQDARSGDLVFWRGDFNGRKDYIYHVGLYLGGGWIYEANGCVRFSRYSDSPSTFYGRIR